MIFLYSLLFTSLVSIFAVMIIPDGQRHIYFENLIGGLAMNFEGPFGLRLLFHGFVVVVGVLILAGAVNTAIVGSNGVLNRVSEDGVLSDWFRQPHPHFGTSFRIINGVVFFQILTILISRGQVDFLANLYAFGVIWSFANEGACGARAAVHASGRARVSRSIEREDRQNRSADRPWADHACSTGHRHRQSYLPSLTPRLLASLFHWRFSRCSRFPNGILRRSAWRARRDGSVQFASREASLTPESVGARPGNVLVPISNYHSLYHLAAVLDRVKPLRRDVVVLHVRLMRRAAAGESALEATQLFGGIEQYLFTQALAMAEKRGKSIKLAVVAANDLWDATVRAAVSLQSSTIVLGHSQKLTVAEQAREIGLAWENLPDPRPPFNLEIFLPGGQREFYLLGPHAPHLTSNEVNLIHQLWLRYSESGFAGRASPSRRGAFCVE